MADGLSIDGGVVTQSAPLLELTQEWNQSAETFAALRLNITDTDSAPGSSLLDLQRNGVSQLSVGRAGAVTIDGGAVTASTPLLNLAQEWNQSGDIFTAIRLNVTDTDSAPGSSLLDLQRNGVSQLSVGRAGSVTIDGGAVTASTPLLKLTQEWNESGEIFAAIQLNVSDTASASDSSLMDLRRGGVSQFKVGRTGAITTPGSLTIGAAIVSNAANAAILIDGARLRWADTPRSGTIGYRIAAGVVQYAAGTLYPLGYEFYVDNGVGLQVDSTGLTRMTAGQKVAVRVVTAAGAVTVTGTDYIVVVNKSVGAATTVNLPADQTGRVYVIKDGKGDAAVNNITLTPAAGTIDGAATYVLNVNYQSARLVYNGSQWNVI